MQKRTKILITLGPASHDKVILKKLLKSGVDLVRLNFSHGSIEEHQERFNLVKSCSAELNKNIGILADLQGPKIRISSFENDSVFLKEGCEFLLDLDCCKNSGNEYRVNVDFPPIVEESEVGQLLCLDDGKIVLKVEQVNDRSLKTRVITGGELKNKKGINLVGGGLSAGAITKKDRLDLKQACSMGVDYIALSFVKNSDDIKLAKKLIRQHNSSAQVLTKVERVEAIENIDEIIDFSDGVMVARGDLAIEVGDAEVPAIQKNIVHKAKEAAKPVIVATQMMESMISNPIPTRAEMSDVANAVLDGADAVMLSAESAVGEYPLLAVEAMFRACVSAEKHKHLQYKTQVSKSLSRVDQAVAIATVMTANRLKIKAIVALTESGMTPLWMSSLQTNIPICALSRHERTLGLLSLYRGVVPIYFDVTKVNHSDINKSALEVIKKEKMVKKGDLVVITKGDYVGVVGGSNAMKILSI